MDSKDIQAKCDQLATAMMGKGLVKPKASATFNGNEACHVMLGWDDKTKTYGNDYKYFRGDEIHSVLDEAFAFVSALPSAEEARRDQFLRALAGVIELGKDNGIEVEFMNPLAAMMKKLSGNIIADQREKDDA